MSSFLPRSETGGGGLEELYNELKAYPDVVSGPAPIDNISREIVVPLRLRNGQRELSFLSTISTFGTATDITLASLAIEAFYPANAKTATTLLEGL